MARGDLNDKQWERLKALLPPERTGQPGRPFADHRRVLNGIVWVLRTGAPWEDMPARYGPCKTCYDRYRRWQEDGTWLRVLQSIQAQEDAAGQLDWEGGGLDASIIKAHQHAAGARRRSGRSYLRAKHVTTSTASTVQPAQKGAR